MKRETMDKFKTVAETVTVTRLQCVACSNFKTVFLQVLPDESGGNGAGGACLVCYKCSVAENIIADEYKKLMETLRPG